MKKQLSLIFIFLHFSTTIFAQITIEDVASISITDKLNINFEQIQSFNFEIRFEDSIELWHTKQISRSEFQEVIFKDQANQVLAGVWYQKNEPINKEKLKRSYQNKEKYLAQAYFRYCATVKPVFIKNIPKNVIESLLIGIQDTSTTKEQFQMQFLANDSTSYGNDIFMTSYYPLVGVSIYTSQDDTLVIYNDGQQDLMIPWYSKEKDKNLHNPLINWSLDAILPKEMNFNKARLTEGLIK